MSLTQAFQTWASQNIASRSHVFRHACSYVDSKISGGGPQSPVLEGEEGVDCCFPPSMWYRPLVNSSKGSCWLFKCAQKPEGFLCLQWAYDAHASSLVVIWQNAYWLRAGQENICFSRTECVKQLLPQITRPNPTQIFHKEEPTTTSN